MSICRGLLLCGLLAGLVSAAPVYTTQQIDVPAGRVQPYVTSFTNSGKFLVGTYTAVSPHTRENWLWDGSALQPLNTYSDGLRNRFEPLAMNESGLIVGRAFTYVEYPDGSSSGSNPLGVLRQPDGSFFTLPLPAGDAHAFSEMAINDQGSVLGVKYNLGDLRAQPYVWLAPGGAAVALPASESSFFFIGEMNNQGSYIYAKYGYTQRIVRGGVEYDTGLSFGTPFTPKINNQNQALLQGYPFDFQFWNGSTLTQLPGSLYALDLNNNGDVLVHALGQGLGVWRNGVVEILPPNVNSYASFPYLPSSAAFNDAGQILVGSSYLGSNAMFIHTPVPEPGTFGLLALSGAVLALVRRRSGRAVSNAK